MANLNNLNEISNLCNENNAALVAVSKTKPMGAIQAVYDEGQRIFGENRASEMEEKYNQLPKDIEWHMIGHLQRNKVKIIAPFVSLIHSLDSFRLAKEVNKQAKALNRTIKVLLQLHIAKEDSKYGFSIEEILELLKENKLQALTNIEICGVMGMATFTDDENQIKAEFAQLQENFETIKNSFFKEHEHFKEISMGMTGDYKIALTHGSTMIRIGSAIFGAR